MGLLCGEPFTPATSHLSSCPCSDPSLSYWDSLLAREGPPMRATTRLDILHHFAAVPDPRDPRFITHRLGDILTIALCATLSGAKSFEDLAAFGRAKETWLRSLGLTAKSKVSDTDSASASVPLREFDRF